MLRRLRLVAYRWRALRVRVMVGYVLRPSPDKGYVGAAIAAFGYSGASRGWGGSLPRRRARALAGVAGGQLVVKVGAGDTAGIAVATDGNEVEHRAGTRVRTGYARGTR